MHSSFGFSCTMLALNFVFPRLSLSVSRPHARSLLLSLSCSRLLSQLMGRSPALRSWKPDYGNRREEEKKDIGEGRRSIFVLEAPVFGKRPTGRDACLALRIHIACQECASRRMEVNYEIPYYSPFCCGVQRSLGSTRCQM